MTLQVPERLLPSVFGPGLKLITGAADAAAVRDAVADLTSGPTGVELLVYHPTPDGMAGYLDGPEGNSGVHAPLPAPPSGQCLVASFSDKGRRQMEQFRAWWSKNGPGAAPSVLDLGNGHGEGAPESGANLQLYRHLLQAALEEIQRGAERQTQLAGQLYELRQLNEQSSTAIECMQQQLDRLQVAPCHLMHMLLPWGDTYYRPRSSSEVVRQLLPVSAEGLAGFDLCSPGPREPAGQGQYVVTLWSRETETSLGAWTIPYSKLGQGWFRCALPAALTESFHQLEILVACNTLQGEAPELALSMVGPWHEMYARVQGRSLGQALALLTWGATPGVRVPAPSPVWTAPEGERESAGVAEYHLTPEDFTRIKTTIAGSFEFFQVIWEIGGFRLHPIGPQPATAVLPKCCLPGTDRIVATAQIRSDQAQYPVDYAMCLTSAGSCTSWPDAPDTDKRVLGWSGWQRVHPDRMPHAIALQLAKPLTETADLHIATRMQEGHLIWYHWADWLGVRVRLRYQCLV
jgi:hypothetical protein